MLHSVITCVFSISYYCILYHVNFFFFFFFSSRRRHTRFDCDWSSDVCSSDLSIDSRSDIRRFTSSARLLSVSNNWDTVHWFEHNLGLCGYSALLQQRTPIRCPFHHPPRALSASLWNRDGLQHLHSNPDQRGSSEGQGDPPGSSRRCRQNRRDHNSPSANSCGSTRLIVAFF